uniref:CN hydrolase domain-containing protein n=1 Tax=Rhabditophanes sp. KR3021 TaxID=114890 RepID=A0AC35U9J0_9BILA
MSTQVVKVALVQDGTIIYDTPATLIKVEELVKKAASNGAQLVLFPESFVGGYPKGLNFGVSLGSRTEEGRSEFARYFSASIAYDSEQSETLAKIALQYKIYLVIGVVERDGATLYCSVFYYGPDGAKLGKHRKLIPTALERVVWGNGDGSTMEVVSSEVGKFGALICWENYMPLGIQLYLAPTVDDRDVWLSTMKTIALEGRCFVLSACQFLKGNNFPAGHPSTLDGDKILIRGGSCAVSPLGTVLVEPTFGVEGIFYAECDLAEIIKGKFDLDTVGHYSRPDIFQLIVNDKPQNGIQ